MDGYEQAARILVQAKRGVAFTGAGISAESGIPTFRDPGGIWDQFDPEELGTTSGILGMFQHKGEIIRQFFLSTVKIFEQARTNAGHQGLAELEQMGFIQTVITQNVDNLHTEAGSKKVLEVHGNLYRTRCTTCGRKRLLAKEELLGRARQVLEDKDGFGLTSMIKILPACECGGLTRPDVVMFGEAVQQLNECFRAAAAADVMIVLGTSGVVYPAAALPHQAHQSGAKVIEINPSENSYDAITEVYLREPSAQAMPKVMEHVRKLVGH